MRVAVLGATGHTGALLVPALLRRGADVLACGRDEGALRRLVEAGAQTRRVDATDPVELDDALSRADAVANLAGPFLAVGAAPLEAAIRRGIPYADTTGEQAFMALAQARYHEAARAAGVPVVQALAFEYAFADLVAHEAWPEGGERLDVFYRPRGTSASAGTKKSVLLVMGSPALGHEDGETTPVRSGRFHRTFPTDDGAREGVSFPGGEILTVPRHTPFRTVRTYVPATPRVARTARWLFPAAGALMRGPVLRAALRRVDARHQPPSNARARGEIHLLARRGDREERVLVRTPDPYVATAELHAEAVLRLAQKGARGVLAPAEALDASSILESMRRAMPEFAVTPSATISAIG